MRNDLPLESVGSVEQTDINMGRLLHGWPFQGTEL
jgi:hypothetical protein